MESNTDFNAGMFPMGPDVLSKSPKLCIQLLLLISSLGDCLKLPPKFCVTKISHLFAGIQKERLGIRRSSEFVDTGRTLD